MKILALIAVLFVLSFTQPQVTIAQTPGSAANGTYKFVMEDDLIKDVEFDARTDERGTTTGYMNFTDEAKIIEQDVDGEGLPPSDPPSQFLINVEFDNLTVEKNRAVITGIIRDSSYKYYIGRYVRLSVEDNLGNPEVPDKLTWRICKPEEGGWIPVDAEDPKDQGAYLNWWATDYEVKGDVGIPSADRIPGNLKGCPIYATPAYFDFAEIKKGEGRIHVVE
jgi:hypothetical protein